MLPRQDGFAGYRLGLSRADAWQLARTVVRLIGSANVVAKAGRWQSRLTEQPKNYLSFVRGALAVLSFDADASGNSMRC